LRILIDATTAREGGTVTYLLNMLPALLRRGGQHQYDVLLSSVYQEELANELPEGIISFSYTTSWDSTSGSHSNLWWSLSGARNSLRPSTPTEL